MPVSRHACGMGVGPCTMPEPRPCCTKALRLGIRVLGPVAGLCQLKNLCQRSFLVTENRDLAHPGPCGHGDSSQSQAGIRGLKAQCLFNKLVWLARTAPMITTGRTLATDRHKGKRSPPTCQAQARGGTSTHHRAELESQAGRLPQPCRGCRDISDASESDFKGY